MLEHLISKAELLGELVHDRLIGERLKERLNDLVTPLQRAVRRRHRPVGLELRRGRQQIDAILTIRQHRRVGRIRIDDNEKIELLHRLLHLDPAGLRIRRMTPEHHGPEIIRLVYLALVLKDAIDPARHRNAFRLHQLLRGEAAEDIVIIDIPNPGPMLPRAGLQTIIARQRMRQDAHIRRALHIVMAAEDVGAATRPADIAESQLQNAVGAGIVVAGGMLRAAHAPDNCAWLIGGKRSGNAAKLRTRNAGHQLGFLRGPLLHFLADVFETPDTLTDIFLVLPAILENMVENAPDDGDIRARTQTDIFRRMRCGAREARIANDKRGVILFLRLHQMLKGDRMRLGRI